MDSIAEKFQTSAQLAYEMMMHKILSLELGPGQRLTRRGMAELTGVSQIPVMEALHWLEDEGLVESQPHFGARVVRLTPAFIRDRYEMREAIECQVARILARQITPAQSAEALQLAASLAKHALELDIDEQFLKMHYEFHLKLAEFTGCQSMIDTLRKINYFTIMSSTTFKHHTTKDGAPDHEKLIATIQSGDPDEAERHMRRHIIPYRERLAIGITQVS